MRSILDGITRGGIGHSPLRNPAQHSPSGYQNRIRAEVWGPDKEGDEPRLKARVDHCGNIMATYGLNRLTEMMVSDAGGASAFCNDMAIGTHTRAENSTDNDLGASTQLVTVSRSDAGNRTAAYHATFASDGNASQIHEVGLFQTNQATASMIARTMLGTDSINRGASDEIRVTYNLVAVTA